MGQERAPRSITRTGQFKADLKRAQTHRKCDWQALLKAMSDIVARVPLAPSLLDHPLQGRYPRGRDGSTDCRECHTSNDWLLVYRLPDEESVIFIRCGTHSDLF